MSVRRGNYWQRRALSNSAKAINLGELKIRKLKREYEKSIKQIQKEIDRFYNKVAKEDGIHITNVTTLLSQKETQMTLTEYTDLAKSAGDPVAAQLLIHASRRARLTKLEAVKLRIEKLITELFTHEQDITKETLTRIYENAYYTSIYEIQKKTGIGQSFAILSPTAVEVAINTAWSGKQFSRRIWEHRKQLAKNVEQIITQGVILGESNQKMATKLAHRMEVSYSKAKTLIRTETNYVYNQATLKSYEAVGLSGYIFLATMDLRTSDICQNLDGKRFKSSDARTGVNYPPLHPNCRSTTIPDVEGALEGERIAKDNGKYYHVPSDITYNAWYNQYVAPKTMPTGFGEWKYTDEGMIKPDITHHGYYSPSLRGAPNTVVEVIPLNKEVKREFYDNNGWLVKQIHSGPHKNPKEHPFGYRGEHAHYYAYDRSGKFLHRGATEIREDDRKENSDILPRGDKK